MRTTLTIDDDVLGKAKAVAAKLHLPFRRVVNEALQTAIAMQKGTVVNPTVPLAIAASKLSLEHNLPMADGIILATAKEFNATFWTKDSDFKNISDVKYFPRK
jgi:predicted nucleic acid-binding protein